ncbi:MAG: hypothetical protein HOW73_07860 [Polyangiaceae bacterium]|nr:hypothetical protein [Polyangiaceae bacterium]
MRPFALDIVRNALIHIVRPACRFVGETHRLKADLGLERVDLELVACQLTELGWRHGDPQASDMFVIGAADVTVCELATAYAIWSGLEYSVDDEAPVTERQVRLRPSWF